MSNTNGGPGRPPGVKNGEGKALEPIKKWKPQHEMVVQLHIALHSNESIAELTSLTPQRVSQILNDPQAKEIIRVAQMQLRERLSAEINDGLAAICVKAVENIRETIELEGLAHGSDFKKHQDKVSLEVLKGQGFLSREGQRDAQERSPLTEKLSERLISALEKSNEAAEIAAKKGEIEVQEHEEVKREGDFTLVGKDD